MAGTPSRGGGASERPSVRERWERACEVRVSRWAVRVVGMGGSFAGIWGVTVRCWVVVGDEVEGFEAVEVVDVGFDAVEVVAAALGAVAYAARRVEVEKVRCDGWRAIGAALKDEALRKAEKPLRAGTVAMMD